MEYYFNTKWFTIFYTTPHLHTIQKKERVVSHIMYITAGKGGLHTGVCMSHISWMLEVLVLLYSKRVK